MLLRLAIFIALPLLAVVNPPYREALPGYAFSFPRDHFEHAEFRTEWWYYTGNVWSADGHRFGFELVFFREGERLGARDNPSAWRVDDVYLGNAALTDIDGKRFRWHERVNRAGPGIAGASFAEQRVWNGNWSVDWKGEKQSLHAVTEDFSIDLEASPAKPFVIQGENGVSQKAAGPGRASHYVSFPLLAIAGTVQSGGRQFRVSGQAWMDHEWFTHQLQESQTGWDWFSVQLNDKTELMLFELRRKDGTPDPFSSGTYIAADGRAHHLSSNDFTLQPLDRWTSAKTGGRYPIAWRIRVPSLHLDLQCHALVQDQELAGSRGAKYWEGAVDYSGSKTGVGYLEMTGYDKPMVLR
jgi:predicted secreted hydrolase